MKTPVNLSPEERALITRALQEFSESSNSPELAAILALIKKLRKVRRVMPAYPMPEAPAGYTRAHPNYMDDDIPF